MRPLKKLARRLYVLPGNHDGKIARKNDKPAQASRSAR
jgi:hypothetical protein